MPNVIVAVVLAAGFVALVFLGAYFLLRRKKGISNALVITDVRPRVDVVSIEFEPETPIEAVQLYMRQRREIIVGEIKETPGKNGVVFVEFNVAGPRGRLIPRKYQVNPDLTIVRASTLDNER